MKGLFAPKEAKRHDRTPSHLASLKGEMESLKRQIDKINIDEVEVTNIDFVKKYLRVELSRFARRLVGIIESISIPDTIKVSNFPAQKDTVKVEEIKLVVEAINDLRAIMAQVEYNPTINVEAPKVDPIEVKIPPIKMPSVIVPKPEVTVNPIVDIDLSDLLAALKPLKLLSSKPGHPIAVKVSDGKNWVKAIKEVGERMIQSIPMPNAMTAGQFKKAFKGSSTASGAVGFKITVASAGTPIVLGAINCYKVQISGDTDAGIVCVVGGSSAVRAASGSKNGIVIIPGNPPATIEVDNLSKLWVDAESNGGVICGVYYTR